MDRNEALGIVRKNWPVGNPQFSKALETIIPELKENEDARIRNAIKEAVEHYWSDDTQARTSILSWLEKQGNKTNPYSGISFEYNGHTWGMCARDGGVDITCDNQFIKHIAFIESKVEPKFHAGDFITDGKRIFQIKETVWERNNRNDGSTYCESLIVNLMDGVTYANSTDLKEYHLWTIQDAKDGDVLAAHECYVIFKEIEGLNIRCHCAYHYMYSNKSFYADTLQNKTAFHPATSEQHDTLFQKMKEEGYEWDAEKKVLKIKQNPAEWSEEDEDMLKSILATCKMYEQTVDSSPAKHLLESQENWLKSLKDKVQPKPEWSEEDEKKIMWLVRLISTAGFRELDSDKMPCSRIELLDWLKSIRPQNTWKPSDEMLEALYRVIPENVKEKSEDEMLLDQLYQGLKYGRVLSKE